VPRPDRPTPDTTRFQPSLDLPFARSVHDRAAHRRGEAGLVERLRVAHGTRALRVWRGRAEVYPPAGPDGEARPALVPAARVADDGAWLFLGEHEGAALLAVVLSDDAAPGASDAELTATAADITGSDGALRARAWAGLRELGTLDDLEQGVVVQAVALAEWHRANAYCPRCGAPTTIEQAGWTRRCVAEQRDLYPRTDPAVIMAVVDDADRILLAHAAHWPAGRISTLAGFVEPGEGLEQALRREVAEETGIVVGGEPGDVVYRGSQAWPFPASLMVGFRARAVSTAIRVDDDEITEAHWFTRAGLLAAVEAGDVGLPGRQSIARALIEEWYGGRLPGQW
jgi:NAD+ diphosphatase